MAELGKVTTSRLEDGDIIWAKLSAGGKLDKAVTKGGYGTVVAIVQGRTKVAGGSGRSGYTIHTDRGEIPFSSGMTSHWIATEKDLARQQAKDADAQVAAKETAGLLSGVTAPPPPPFQPPTIPAPTRAAPAKVAPARPAVQPTNGATATRATARKLALGGPAMPVGLNAAKNYRAMARVSTTDHAREYWTALAEAAEAVNA